jgi:hypothetical protein
MATIRSSIHGDPDCSIDPETRGAIFDMLTRGYTQTSRAPYVSPVSRIPRPAPVNTLTFGNLDAESTPRLVAPPGSFEEVSHLREIP